MPAEDADEVIVVSEQATSSQPAPKKKLQFCISKFFGTPEQQKSAFPVLQELRTPYSRSTKSRAQLEAEATKEAYEDLVAQLATQEQAQAVVQKRRKLVTGKQMVQAGLREEMQRRRKSFEKRLELSANREKLIAQDMLSEKESFASEKDLWSAMQSKHGLNKRQLSNILNKHEQYKQLSQKPLEDQNTRNKKRVRAAGAGRKQPYPEVVAAVAQWLALERNFGHTISKGDPPGRVCCSAQSVSNRRQKEG